MRGEAFIAEVAVDFVDALQAAHHQPLEVKLRGDAQVEVDVERVVVGDERPRRGAPVDRLHHGGFHFDEAAGLELPAQRGNDLGAGDEDLAHVGVGDQVEIALAVARFHVLQAVPLLRHGEQRLGELFQTLHVQAQLPCAGAEQVPFGAHDIADVEPLVELEVALRHAVTAHVDLQALAVLLQVGETGLPHAAQGSDASGYAHAHRLRQLLGGSGAVLGQDGGDSVGEIVTAAVGTVAQRLQLPSALQALLKQLVFQGQMVLLTGENLIIAAPRLATCQSRRGRPKNTLPQALH